MSRLVVVGGSSGIGMEIQEELCEPRVITTLPRDAEVVPDDGDYLLFCQRYRGSGDNWHGEFQASLTRTKMLIESAIGLDYLSIVVIVSVAGVSVEEEQPVGYHMAKAALIEMVKWYAVTAGPRTRVNAIIPGVTVKQQARAFYDAHPELEQTYSDITPLGRMGTMEDLAHVVDFLISPQSGYITGQTITVDGGIGLRSAWALARKVSPQLRDLQVTQRAVAK